MAAEECKIEDSGEIPLEKPYKDPISCFFVTSTGHFRLLSEDATYRGKLDEEL